MENIKQNKILKLKKHTNLVMCIIDPKNGINASCLCDKTIIEWDVNSNNCILAWLDILVVNTLSST